MMNSSNLYSLLLDVTIFVDVTEGGELVPVEPTPANKASLHPDIAKLVKEYAAVFPSSLPKGLPVARPTDHRIDLQPDSKVPAHRIYRMAPEEDRELLKQLTSYIEAGHIEPSKSAFGAGVLFARKKDGS